MKILKKAFILWLLACSVAAYILCLLAIFGVPFQAQINSYLKLAPVENIQESLLSFATNRENRTVYFIFTYSFLMLPTVVAAIFYIRKRTKSPNVNRQFSAAWHSIIDLALAALATRFTYALFLIEESAYEREYWVRYPICALLILSALVFWFSQPFHLFRNFVSQAEANKYLKRLVSEPPCINFCVNAYHYETKIIIVPHTSTDSKGNRRTTYCPQPYTKKITTLDRCRTYPIKYWRDATFLEVLISPPKTNIAKVEIISSITAADKQTREHYRVAFSNFKSQHKGADTYVNFSVRHSISGMNSKRLLVYKEGSQKPLFLNALTYFLVSLTPFCWAYSLWLDSIASVSKKTISKEYSQFYDLVRKQSLLFIP